MRMDRGASNTIVSAPPGQALAELGVDPSRGLSQAEVAARLEQHGHNEVLEKRAHPVLGFLAKFWGISAWMLELIMALSLALGKYSDFVIVAALLLVNAALSFAQEQRAAGVVEALRRRLQVSARALREGTWRRVAARELVPGDIVRMRLGDVVPADLRLLDGELRIDQSALTGESAEARKVAGDVVPSGALVRRGEAGGVVIFTGADTYFGRTTELVQLARPKLHIEEVVANVVRWLLAIVGILLASVAALSLARGLPLLETLPLLLVLLMSAVPVALPVMFTVSMAVGAGELSRNGVLVTRLSAAEDAAIMDVLCVDKTGTITANRLAVAGVVALDGATEADVLLAGALASREANQDPIDLAFLDAARERGVFDGAGALTPLSFTPFDPAMRRTEAVVLLAGERTHAMKGAVRALGEACGLPASAIAALEARAVEAAAKGHRVLAVARGPEGGAARLIGLVSLSDPPRADARRLIRALGELGVGVKMLTGDALAVAQEIGGAVGLPDIRKAADAASNLESDGFAEVYPDDKYRVVKALQSGGHVTGMTGDGVNDAPALRQAEIGIAVSEASDVAKSAASVVLTDPGLANIVSLVEQGRIIYQRILTWIINKVSRTVLKAAFVATAFVFTGKFVISAFAMLLLVFMTDFAKIALATDRVRWSRRPETWNIGPLLGIAALLGAAMTFEALLLLYLCWTRFGLESSDAALATFSFLTLLYFAVFSIVSARERARFWATRPSAILAAALGADVLLGTAVAALGLPGLAPLPWPQIAAIFLYAMVACLLVNDALKAGLLARLRFAPPS